MSKDFKEKYERVCAVKDRALALVESQINGNTEMVDAKELGEVADIAKDMAELMKLCAEAEYYHTITEAMEKNSDAQNKGYMDEYLPESRMKYTRPRIMYGDHDDVWDSGSYRKRMYYTNPNMDGGNQTRDMREGRAGITRRTYMEMKDSGTDKNTKMQEFDTYMHDLADDMIEMVEGMDSNEKAMVKQKVAQLANKIV